MPDIWNIGDPNDPVEKLKKALDVVGGVATPPAPDPPAWYTQEGQLGQAMQLGAKIVPGLGIVPDVVSTYLPHAPGVPKPPEAMTDDELKQAIATNPADTGAVAEEKLRAASAGRNFLQNLTDPQTMSWAAGRLLKQVGAGTRNAVDIPAQLAGLYSLGSMGAEKLADMVTPVEGKTHDFGSSAASDFANERYAEALRAADVSPPREFGESAANIAGGLVPVGGSDIKGA
ncbi:MAG TPA: hypothetical protein VN039_12355, partial [Nitrospira sp.]|nr:hypothetical protein [Nitrospira sp.]